MNTYERHDTAVATVFGRTRPPVGAELYATILAAGSKPLDQIELLDAGCGTGAYAIALADRVSRVVGIDVSDAMLSMAKRRVVGQRAADRLTFHLGNIEALPFCDSSFDAVMFNQVLHHLESGVDPEYGAHGRALAEAHRVLRPGGVLIANVCTHDQLRRGFWYYDLIPAAVERSIRRCIPADRLDAMLAQLGFAIHGHIVPHDGVMQGPTYFDPWGPLDAKWRRTDSIWSLVQPDELASAQERIWQLAREHRIMNYLVQRDAARRRTGQFTFFVAVRGAHVDSTALSRTSRPPA
jgi:ubiquinone/menaquinone biosynthesis C-methylase UbiE